MAQTHIQTRTHVHAFLYNNGSPTASSVVTETPMWQIVYKERAVDPKLMNLKYEHLKGNQIHGFSAYSEFIKNEKN